MMKPAAAFKRFALLTTSALSVMAAPAFAQEAISSEEIIVTASRRAVNLQDVPINVSAVSADLIEAQGINDLESASVLIPGIFIPDQSSREGNPIIARGLSATSVSGIGTGTNGGGDTVATYVGEVPFYVNLNLVDMERVEFLLGPQGTLYGAGTLGGAIRYIPNRPRFDESTIEYRADLYGYAEGAGISSEIGTTFNIPILDNLALRASIDSRDDQGFIDYSYLVREIGVSEPDPDFSDPADVAANLYADKDANTERTLSTRLGLRWQPLDSLDLNLTYYSQASTIDGRNVSHYRSLPATEKYEAAFRVPEWIERNNEMLALEGTLDLGWASLISATAYTQYGETGQRDQTPLLVTLEYGYDLFPAFTAYTFDTDEEETFTQELRLVSQFEGPFSFILGGFFNRFENEGVSYEFTPGLADFFGVPGGGNPDAIEFFSFGSDWTEETAIYGEASYQVTPKWQVTLGTRWYSYEFEAGASGAVAPLGDSTPLPSLEELIATVGSEPQIAEDDGFLYKFNTSYNFTDDFMAYFTYSEGYRLGGSNGIPPCTPQQIIDGNNGIQVLCALEDEFAYQPDTTTNYELGVRTAWFDGDLILNGALYFIEWDGIQLASATLFGGLPITTNGGSAETIGLELQGSWRITDHFSLRGSYAYNQGELTSDVEDLIIAFADPATLPPSPFTLEPEDGLAGDRLPGYPEHQAALYATYETPLANGWSINWSYGAHGVSDVITRTGLRGGGETIDGYIIHDAFVTLDAGDWTATLYANNLYNEFYETGVNSTSRANQLSVDDLGNPVTNRRYFSTVGAPRVIGVRLTKEFGG